MINLVLHERGRTQKARPLSQTILVISWAVIEVLNSRLLLFCSNGSLASIYNTVGLLSHARAEVAVPSTADPTYPV